MKVNVRQGGCFFEGLPGFMVSRHNISHTFGQSRFTGVDFLEKDVFLKWQEKIINKFSPGAYGLDDWQGPCRVRLIDED